MSKMYAELDALILHAIRNYGACLYNKGVRKEAGRIADATGRDADRVIDGRTQALRKKGNIEYVHGKWYVTEQGVKNGKDTD